MAADSDGCTLITVVTCEGDLFDPSFKKNFNGIVNKLNGILGEAVKVHKLEPWNSVRVTLSIPREAALRLRKLATEGSAQLRALGILSVQVEGDQVISLRVANAVTAETQEIRIQTTQDGGASSSSQSSSTPSTAENVLGRFLSSAQTTSEFKSPNVVCPPDSVVPVPKTATSSNHQLPPSTTKTYAAPFPFTSMNQAMHYAQPPPPYPGSSNSKVGNVTMAATATSSHANKLNMPATSAPSPNNKLTGPSALPNNKLGATAAPPQVTISSPLLVNLLQNDGNNSSKNEQGLSLATPVISNNSNNNGVNVNKTVRTVQMPRTQSHVQKNTTKTQATTIAANITTNSLSPPSALSNTSISKPNSTITNLMPPSYPNNLPPPPPYSVAVTNRFDSLVQTSPYLDLTPSLTDLKSDDLEHLLPTLERDLARSPPEIPDEITQDKRNFLINPLTGELEPQSSCESDDNEMADVFTGLPSPANISDEDTNSTIRPDTTDQSDSETKSSHSDSGKHRKKVQRGDRGRDGSPNLLKPTEKIKLRLKLEKSEPVSSAYKVDVSFIQQPKKAQNAVVANATVATTPTTPGEELRVPPLHISLRGRHHAFITNKKKKLNQDKPKIRKQQDLTKIKSSNKDPSAILTEENEKKKFKSNHEHDTIHTYKEKQKERRGSDSELSRNNMKFDSNGMISVEKKRRLSQSEPGIDINPPILGSTNIGTIAGLPQKSRKDKNKLKDLFKSKEVLRNKNFGKNLGDKFSKQVSLPTGEIDMEAKFKQRLMEGTEKGIPRPPHRTECQMQVVKENNQIEKSEQVIKVESEHHISNPDTDEKCATPDRHISKQPPDQITSQRDHHSRSPNSGAQGEDSGIESMDALSEKSPNQASQSPHADIPETSVATAATPPNSSSLNDEKKNQVPEMPDMMDIEAQLAKMEGLNGVEECGGEKLCELTTALQDSLGKKVDDDGGGNGNGGKEQAQQPTDVSSAPTPKTKTKEDDLEPLPVRVTPPLYTYSNPEKTTRASSESPPLSDEDSNCSNNVQSQQPQHPPQQQQHNNKTKSLLEQLLIEIPDNSNGNQTPSSPSPATRSSMRTRAHSKVGSPELNSPVTASKARSATPASKRKRHESDSSNNSVEDIARNKKTRKCSENAAELIKACMGVDNSNLKMNNVKKGVGLGVTPPPNSTNNNAGGGASQTNIATPANKLQDESSDSDEPLIEKVRKTTQGGVVNKKVKSAAGGVMKGAVNTRRSVRTTPATNTRSRGDKAADTEAALRRKTRSGVSEGDSKRKKEVK